MEKTNPTKPPMTPAQKRLLSLVIVMGGVVLVLFVLVLGLIAWQIAHLK